MSRQYANSNQLLEEIKQSVRVPPSSKQLVLSVHAVARHIRVTSEWIDVPFTAVFAVGYQGATKVIVTVNAGPM
jgi:hypothetical protein